MKNTCERCQASLNYQNDAYICSYECTFCPDCTNEMNNVCPNCNGELMSRPKRKTNPSPEENLSIA